MTEEERIFRGELFASEEPELVEKKRRAHRLSQKYNETFEDDAEVREAILRELLGELGEGVCMLGPVRFHYGCHTRVGNHCFMNFNFTVQDDALVTIGDHCNFGPNVTIDAHAPHAARRAPGDGVRRWGGAVLVLCQARDHRTRLLVRGKRGGLPRRDHRGELRHRSGERSDPGHPCGLLCRRQSGPGHPPDYGGGYRPRPLPRHPGGIKTEGLDNSSRPSQSIEKVFSTDC